MTEQADDDPKPHWSADLIHRVEHGIYIAIGIMLVLALMLALAGSARVLVEGLADWSGTTATFNIIDRLLFVLMMVEILHTVHASIRTGTLVCEPFLIVGLIACIRRVLVITLETSQITHPDHWKPEVLPLFHASMLELGVLALLIAVLVGSIRLTRPSEKPMAPDAIERRMIRREGAVGHRQHDATNKEGAAATEDGRTRSQD